MPTLRGLRRRGYPASAIREFCNFIGVSRTNSRHQIELLESFVRTELNRSALRRMAVIRPLKVVVTNWPTGAGGDPVVEMMELANNPENADDGTRMVPFTGEFFIEHEDFMAEPAPKYFRLSPGKEVRLRGAYFVTATGFDTDDDGNVVEVQVTYDPETRGGTAPDGRKVKSTMHWVSAAHAVDASVALYDRLFTAEIPGESTGDAFDDLNPRVPGTARGCQGRTGAGRRGTGPGRPVRATRLLRARSRPADVVPPNGRPARRMGQHPEALLTPASMIVPRPLCGIPLHVIVRAVSVAVPSWA